MLEGKENKIIIVAAPTHNGIFLQAKSSRRRCSKLQLPSSAMFLFGNFRRLPSADLGR